MYNYNCTACSTQCELSKKIANRDNTGTDSCNNCGSTGTLNRQVSSALVGYSTYVNGGGKPPEGFRQVLRQIHKRAPGSKMDVSSSFLT